MKSVLCPHGILGWSKCKECRKEYYKQYDEKRTGTPKRLEQNRKSSLKNRVKTLQHQRERYFETNGAYDKNRDRSKIRARRRVQRVYLYPLADKCELCPENDKRTENLQHGHIDYDYPKIYLTVCGSCNIWMDKPIGV